MRRARARLALSLAAAASLVLAGCGSEDSPMGPGGNASDLDGVVRSGGAFEEVQESNEVVDETTVTEVVGNESYFCTTTTISVVEAPTTIPQFDPNADIIYPGNLLHGATLGQATPNPIPVRRGSGTIVMTILNGSNSVSKDIPEVSLANVLNAQNQIIAEASNTLPARFSFDRENVQSREQLALALDMRVGNLTGSLGASLDFSTDREYNRYVVKLNQSYFTMAYQLPTSTAGFFASNLAASELAPYIYDGNPGAFIGSVTYGRIFYLLVESTSTRTEMDASIQASFSAAIAQGSLDAGVKYVQDLDNVKIKAYALGGEASSALGAITTNFEELKSFLAQGGRIDTGVPLSYVVRSLANPDRIIGVKIATTYDVTNCVPVGESFANPIFWYKANENITTSSGRVTRWQNSFGDATLDATPPTGKTTGGRLIANAVNGLPAVRFGPKTASDDANLAYPGLDFADTDYTVFTVLQLSSLIIDYPTYFLFGSSGQAFKNLPIGFRNPTKVTHSHQGSTLDADTPIALTDWVVYSVRFSRTEGMSFWINGSPTPAGTAPSNTAPLTEYIGARIGSSTGAVLDMAEIKAYGQAVNDAQRKYIVDELLVKYSL